MAAHNELGHRGEDFATQYLQSLGYVILARNWRHRQKEIDIVAMDGAQLVFVEVKTRVRMQQPAELISSSKIYFLEAAAEAYINKIGFVGEARFDLILLVAGGQSFELEHIKSAFR